MAWLERPEGMTKRQGFHAVLGWAIFAGLALAAVAGFFAYQPISSQNATDESLPKASARVAAQIAYPALVALLAAFSALWATTERHEQSEYLRLHHRAVYVITSAISLWGQEKAPKFEVMNVDNGDVLARLPTGQYRAEAVQDFTSSHLTDLNANRHFLACLISLDLLNDLTRLGHTLGTMVMSGPTSDAARASVADVGAKVAQAHESLAANWEAAS